MKTIEQQNAMIAEFMGLSYCTKHLYEGWYKDSEYNHRICDFNGLKYHASWDWLMPVVEKCRECQTFGTQHLISNIDFRLMKLDLLGTHANVVDFIIALNRK